MSEEEEPEGSGCAGATVIAAVVLATVLGLYAISRTAFILLVWIIGWGTVIWAARKPVPSTPDPAPPPPSEGAVEKEPQVSVIRDTGHPNRWLILEPSRWMASNINDRDEP